MLRIVFVYENYFCEKYGCDKVLICLIVTFFLISTMRLLIEVHYSWQGKDVLFVYLKFSRYVGMRM